MNKLAEIIQVTSQHNGQVMFDDALNIKSSPHQHLFTAWGICVGPDGVYVLNGAGEWHGPLLENQVNGELMIGSIYQRLKAIQQKPSVVVASYDENVNAIIFE